VPLLPETAATLLHGAIVTVSDTAVERGIPEADCVVIDTRIHGVSGIEVLQGLRARGYPGGAVLLVEDSGALASAALRYGATQIVERAALVHDLAPAVVRAVREAGPEEVGAEAMRELRRAQRLMAAGEVALGLQHALNNPLAALLAEAQLLEMEPLDIEQLGAVRRIVAQCRRVIAVTKRLEGIDGRERG
jgi:signal transduction histidine kinase